MRTRSFALFAGLCLAGGLAFASTTEFAGLQKDMSPTEFQNAGLNKLSPDELAALDAWLKTTMEKRVAVALAEPKEDRHGFLEPRGDRTKVVSRILGEFRGWSGGTRFKLENGQEWIQIEASTLTGVKLSDPEVTITPGMMGDWKLKVKGYNTLVKVKRTK